MDRLVAWELSYGFRGGEKHSNKGVAMSATHALHRGITEALRLLTLNEVDKNLDGFHFHMEAED